MCETYYAYLSTNKYGLTYLDSVKCKARNFDLIKATKKQEERIHLALKRFKKISKEKGYHTVVKEAVDACKFNDTLLKLFLNKLNPEVLISGIVFVKINNQQNSHVIFEGRVRGSNFLMCHLTHSSINKAFKLIGYKIKLYDDDVKIIAVKVTKEAIFLEVKENVEGELIYYKLEYENNIVLFLQ
ncbi:9455_t:CDS:2 [Funneliformis caledonium]|uniref:9455_t:CDS:1 n=1 Tax=Funneliformis caledonium TaxID=1117310 RepID=A0A9N9NAN5_9GLOM|nr:9455_t:CDS:2 [Funneliformis caledonium]